MAYTPTESIHGLQPGSSLGAPEHEEARFLKRYPDYEKTRMIDDLRQGEYTRLDRLGQIYLDYTGGGLYSEKQVSTHLDLLMNHVYGNPHSTNPTSLAMTRLVESARAYVLSNSSMPLPRNMCAFSPRMPAGR